MAPEQAAKTFNDYVFNVDIQNYPKDGFPNNPQSISNYNALNKTHFGDSSHVALLLPSILCNCVLSSFKRLPLETSQNQWVPGKPPAEASLSSCCLPMAGYESVAEPLNDESLAVARDASDALWHWDTSRCLNCLISILRAPPAPMSQVLTASGCYFRPI